MGNFHRWSQGARASTVSYEYRPVTPDRSSTGLYNGGPPRGEILSAGDPRIQALWYRARMLQGDTPHPGPDRAKGTGAFALTAGTRSEQFIVSGSDALAAWESLTAGFGVVAGIAEDAKSGAIVWTDDGRVYYLQGMDRWPQGVRGSRVRVSGSLMTVAPSATEQSSSEPSASIPGRQHVIAAPCWEPE